MGPLSLEYFFFPLALLSVGLFLSTLAFLAEIIIHRLTKSKTDISKARLEEPSVTQSTTESEVEHENNV